MKSIDLTLRCMGTKDGGQWSLMCLDLCLAVQADSFEEAKKKLERQICEYVTDALVGEDKDYADQLMSRRAPAQYWAQYYLYKTLNKIGAVHNGAKRLFMEPVPLQPVCNV